jgi:alcohol dehydrogenase class IV
MHQMGHVLSALYNTPHGVTLAIFMDAFFRYTSKLNEERARRFALLGTKIFGLDPALPVAEAAEKTVSLFIEFMDEIGVAHTLTAAGIPHSDIEKIADEIVAHGCNAEGMLPSLPPIGRDGIIEVLNMAK